MSPQREIAWRPSLAGRVALPLLKLVAVPSFKLYFRLRAEGRERIPPGPALLAPNHVSFLDPFVLQAVLRRRIFYMVTSDFYDRRKFGWFLRLLQCIRVDESGSNVAAVRAAHAVLAGGGLIGIFPEGAISRDGRLRAGLPGAAALMLMAGVPVVPVGLDGTFRALRRSARFPRPARVTVRFGEPIDISSEVRAAADRRGALQRVTESLMQTIAELARVERSAE
ncbi:MAG: lysophospholipid acyltransferase family protein [Planctomycetota bacterium]